MNESLYEDIVCIAERRGYMEQKERVLNAEDRVLKAAAQAFGENVMRYLGQKGTIKRIAPTEHVHLEMKQMMEDFNFEMEEGYWRHYEFESDRISIADMRRFREYEAFLSMTHKVPVITTVLCSAKVKKLRSSLKEGINTYNVETIQLKKQDADKVLRRIHKKIETGKVITKDDLIPVLLTPLMSGKSRVYERIEKGFRILKTVQDKLHEEELKKMQAILYAFACKFLDRDELGKIKEETGMTLLGQMLMEDGFAKGMEKGMEKGTMQTLVFFVKSGLLKVEDAAKHVNMSEDAFVAQMNISE